MEGKVILLVVIGTIGVMLMAFSVVFFVLLYKRRMLQNELELKAIESKHQQEMLAATLRSQESERNRLGTELHDGVGAMLSSIKMNLQVTKRNESVKNLDPILGHLDETISQVRIISHQMMPIVLKKYGLKRAIEDLFEKVSNEDFKAEIKLWTDPKISDESNVMLYRIIQELTNNTIKHANAGKAFIEFTKDNERVKVSYHDNGNGYPEGVLKESNGMGLLNIQNRSQSLNAQLSFSNLPSGGAVTDLVFPISND